MPTQKTSPRSRTGRARATKSAPKSSTVTGTPVGSRRTQYLIALRRAARARGSQPLEFDALREELERDPEIEIKRTLAPVTPAGIESGDAASSPVESNAVVVATMSDERAATLRTRPQLIVEPDYPVMLSLPSAALVIPRYRDPGVIAPYAEEVTVRIVVTGAEKEPLAGATVFVFGSVWPALGVTNANGQVALSLVGESTSSIHALYVKPRAGYWSRWIARPALEPNKPNVVALTPLSQTFPGFPDEEIVSWGERAMRVDKLPAEMRGSGATVAIIDSGLATIHADLKAATCDGYDAITRRPEGWARDTVGHGTHVAGVIAGSQDGRGIRGFAPEASLFAIKLFPEGRVSNLIDALDRCIERGVDLVNMSLGCDQWCETLEQKIQEAKEAGIACFAAAGSTGSLVQFPAASPNVFAVSAVGHVDAFPTDSYHATTMWDGVEPTPDGYFSPGFTCFGPEVDVCAPGVAVLSCVPPNGYAAWDGTSVAAAHVTGLAALVLAHHPDFQSRYTERTARRVDHLFHLLKASARPLDLGSHGRTGFGLPDAVRALGLLEHEVAEPAFTTQASTRTLKAMLAAVVAGRLDLAETAAALPSLLEARDVETAVGERKEQLARVGTIMREAGLFAEPPEPRGVKARRRRRVTQRRRTTSRETSPAGATREALTAALRKAGLL